MMSPCIVNINKVFELLDMHGGSIVTIATVFLVILTGIYVWLTRKLVKIQAYGIMEPMIGFDLRTEPEGNDFITRVYVMNNSRFFCQVWTNLNLKVYNSTIKHSPRYDGEEPWNVLPGAAVIGWFSISEVLQKTGRKLQQVITDSNINVDQKITVDVQLKAKGLPGGEIEYPSLHWYLELSPQHVRWVYMS